MQERELALKRKKLWELESLSRKELLQAFVRQLTPGF